MDIKRLAAAAATLLWAALPLRAQSPTPWTWKTRLELRANYRDSEEARFALRFPFPPDFLPVGQTVGFERTVDPGHNYELSVLNVQLDAAYAKWFAARAKVHGIDKYRRNPTSTDRKVDADELWIRFGEAPEFLERPERTSFFLQLGKAPKMERQPTRLLESYGLAATAFNRFEDLQALAGGSVGRNLYWRLQLANGNPLFFRDANALAGDNGTPDQMQPQHPHPNHALGSGFPILYNAEVEEYAFNRENLQFGQGLGYRWQNEAQTLGFDVLLFHYRRTLADTKELTGTFYGGDLDLLSAPLNIALPTKGRNKEETGARVYSEWGNLTAIGQFTHQDIAGLHRDGYELETGYRIPLARGWLEYVQPAGRLSGIRNDFRAAAPKTFPAPSIWWPWTKIDLGVRIGFAHGLDVTLERAKHNVGSPVKLDMDETLVTLRFRV